MIDNETLIMRRGVVSVDIQVIIIEKVSTVIEKIPSYLNYNICMTSLKT